MSAISGLVAAAESEPQIMKLSDAIFGERMKVTEIYREISNRLVSFPCQYGHESEIDVPSPSVFSPSCTRWLRREEGAVGGKEEMMPDSEEAAVS